MYKERVKFAFFVTAFVFLFFANFSLAEAYLITVRQVNESFSVVSISDAVNLYSYELNFDYEGEIRQVRSANFLGPTNVATYDYSIRDNFVSVYGSRLDHNSTGISGSGFLFNISYNGIVSLRDAFFVLNDSSQIYFPYNDSVIYNCRFLSRPNEVYVLNRTLFTGSECLHVRANNVTIDFGGKSLVGEGLSSTNGIVVSGYNSTSIVNGNLINFSYGLNLSNTNNVSVSDFFIGGSKVSGVYVSNSNGLKIQNTEINSSLENGIYLDSGVGDLVLSNVRVMNLNFSGWDLQIGPSGAEKITLQDILFNRYNFGAVGGLIEVIKTGVGEVRFLQSVNGSGTNLTRDVFVAQNFVDVRSDLNAGLNRSANITFFNMPGNFVNPVILRNGASCPSGICYNFTSLNAPTVIFRVSEFTNYSIGEGDSIYTPNPKMSSSDISKNGTLQDLYCFDILNDAEGDRMNVSVRWYKNNVLQFSLNYTNNSNGYSNGSLFVAVLSHGNTTKNENWSCEMQVHDGKSSSEWVMSSSLRVLNSLPENLVLISPGNLNSTFNRRVSFDWSAFDADGDSLVYDFNLTAHSVSSGPLCSDFISEVSLLYSNYTPIRDLRCLYDNGYVYNWTVRARDSEGWSEWSEPSTFFLRALLDIQLLNSTINFGTLNLSSSENTTDNSPEPFVVQNNGNSLMNVNISAGNLWISAPNPSSNFMFKIGNFSGFEGSFDWFGSLTNWANFSSVSVLSIFQLNHTQFKNRARVDLAIQVPSNEPSGMKNTTIEFFAFLGE